ncbi:MAG: hypothetical protein ACT4P7_03895 [Gemmatimonadaceae bacterium]
MMTSRTKVVAAMISGLLLTVAPLTASGQRGQPPVNKGELRIVNATPDSIRVELRIGPNLACDQNPLVGVRTLDGGKRWTVRATRPLCYRFLRDPARSSTWSGWVRRVPARSSVVADSV